MDSRDKVAGRGRERLGEGDEEALEAERCRRRVLVV